MKQQNPQIPNKYPIVSIITSGAIQYGVGIKEDALVTILKSAVYKKQY